MSKIHYRHLCETVADAAHSMVIDLSERRTKRGVDPDARAYIELADVQSWATLGEYEAAGTVARTYASLEGMRRIEAADISRVHVAFWDERRAAVTA